MADTYIRTDRADGIFRITVDREDKLNALNRDMLSDLRGAFDAARMDEKARVVIFTGAGDRAFIAGADIAELRKLDSETAARVSGEGQDLTLAIQRLGKPVIAAINGYALGGGCEMALACTLRIASSNAMLGLPEVKLGVLPGYGGTQRLLQLTGRGTALEMVLTGEPVTAQRAFELGLVNRVVEPEELEATVNDLAARLARSAPIAMRRIMEAIDRGADLPLTEGLEVERSFFGEIFATEDMREGTAAFLEKRKPVFKGK